LTSGIVEFPCEVLALANSEGFNFFKLQKAKAMPDNVPLFGLKVQTKEEFLSLLRGRGLGLDP
jgi:hypothetical protein